MPCFFLHPLAGLLGFGARTPPWSVDAMPNTIRFRQAPTGTGMKTMTSSCLAARSAPPHGRATRLPGATRPQLTAGWCNLQPQPCE